MNKKFFTFMFMFLFAITLVSAYQEGSINLRQETNLTSCNVTIAYPNTTLIVDNQVMSDGAGFVNYTFDSNDVLGEYNYFIICGSTSYSGAFDVTLSGNDVVDGVPLAMMILLCFVIFVGTIYTLLSSFEKGVKMEVDITDVVKSFTAFGLFLLYYWFAFAYWGDTFVMSLLEVSLWVVGFMSLFVAPCFFIISILNRMRANA